MATCDEGGCLEGSGLVRESLSVGLEDDQKLSHDGSMAAMEGIVFSSSRIVHLNSSERAGHTRT